MRVNWMLGLPGALMIGGARGPSLPGKGRIMAMGGAVAAMAVAWRIARRFDRAATGAPLLAPPDRRLDGRLFAGSALFGLGGEIAGFRPGPASARIAPWPFHALLVGMGASPGPAMRAPI